MEFFERTLRRITGGKKSLGKRSRYIYIYMLYIALRVVRVIRKFDLKHSCQTKPYAWYILISFFFVSWANYALYRRLIPMYPNYEEYRTKEGGRMLEAKMQEIADVARYNKMVSTMRSEVSKRQ